MMLGDKPFIEEKKNLESKITANGYDNFLFRYRNMIDDYTGIVSQDIMEDAIHRYNLHSIIYKVRNGDYEVHYE